MKKKGVDMGILYICIHKRLSIKSKKTKGIYPKKEFFTMLGRDYFVPRRLWAVVLKEMELKGMVKNLGTTRNYNILVMPLFVDPEEDANKFYQQLGMF